MKAIYSGAAGGALKTSSDLQLSLWSCQVFGCLHIRIGERRHARICCLHQRSTRPLAVAEQENFLGLHAHRCSLHTLCEAIMFTYTNARGYAQMAFKVLLRYSSPVISLKTSDPAAISKEYDTMATLESGIPFSIFIPFILQLSH